VTPSGKSLWLFVPGNTVRKLCVYVFNLPHFEIISNVMVLFSTVLLTIDHPLDNPNSKKQ